MTFAQPVVDTVDDGLRAYVWGATATGIGRHPERITDLELRRRTVAIVTELDTVALDSPTRDVPDWVAREVDDVVALEKAQLQKDQWWKGQDYDYISDGEDHAAGTRML